MSYDPIKDTGTSPPVYPYFQPTTGTGEAVGYQLSDRTPGSSNGANIERYNPPPPPDPEQDEESEIPRKDPSTVSVAHLNLDFKECFHEHESTKTIDGYYKVLGLTYKYVKIFTYHFFVFIFGFILAIVFALLNGFMSFIHVWIFGPMVKITLLWVYALIPLAVAPLKAFFLPLVDMHARIFRQIRVHISGPVTAPNQRSNV